MLKIIKRMPFLLTILAIVFIIIQILCELTIPLFTADMIDKGVLTGNITSILQQGGVMLLLACISFGGAFLNVFLSSKIAYKLSVKLREDIFTKIMSFSREDFDKIGESSLITRSTNDVTQVQNLIEMGLKFLIISPLLIFGSCAMAYYKSPNLANVYIDALPIIFIISFGMIIIATPIYGKLQKKLDQLTLIFREGLTGLKIIRSFHQGEFELKRFELMNKDYTKSAIQTSILEGSLVPLTSLTMGIASLFMIWVAGHDIIHNVTQIGTITAFMTYSVQILMGVLFFTMIFSSIPRGRTSAKRINEILDLKSEIQDREITSPSITDSQDPLLQFDSVEFFHKGAETYTLSNLSFTLEAGKTLAIIGGTGSGKSTIAHLISRFYDAQSGTIFVNNTPIKNWVQKDLRNIISFVPQKSLLFAGTIRENIKLGYPSATDEEIWDILNIAQAGFVRELEQGLDSVVEAGGRNFSGGQRQRLSIARALIKKANIYIFDDSFSALDYKTDSLLRKAIKPLLKDSGTVMIAQRVSTIIDADQILVLDNGRIAGIGTHTELKETNRVYQEIIESQFDKEELV